MDGVWIVTDVVVGKLPQPFQFGVDGGGTGEVGVEGSWLGAHRWLRDVIDDATMNALFNLEAKLFPRLVDRKNRPENIQLILKIAFLLMCSCIE